MIKRKQTILLAGTMDSAKDYGIGWRKKIKPKLEKRGFIIIDPTQGYENQAVAKQKSEVDVAKEKKDWVEFTRLMDRMWEYNSSWVTQSDFVIAHFTHLPENWGGGTTRELQVAFDQGKPVYLIYDGDIMRIKNHLLHLFVKNGRIFKTFEELLQFLKQTT